MKLARRLTTNIREVVFGLEDSFVSTMGAVSGIAVGSGDMHAVLLAGTVLVTVEALSMAAGSYLSSKAATELYEERLRQDASRVLAECVADSETLKQFFKRKGLSAKEVGVVSDVIMKERKIWLKEVQRCEYKLSPAVGETPLSAALIMGTFYIIGGLLVLLPYILFPLAIALPAALLLTVCLLFFLGVWKASIAGVNRVQSGMEMVAVSLGAALLGMVIGRLYTQFFI
jgi:vacuolar iron transporter family protein